ncbi:penicillin-binding protein 2B [Evansella caseinilytica]|uniref:serine-type D-Ala-D-Ala carboxypeptidase n=1 Tax=Evansella caseinilytica TaxID=1503961 RepID=A0A1H3MIN5_9BACI|nr:penicillin-binding protein [Evansella caseinilytica]SDY76238.1 penicillin-binding protein 2B [Evansella caseinilytica]
MEQKKSKKIIIRALVVLCVFFIGVSVVFSRFVYIQAEKEVQGQDLQTLLEARWSQKKIIEGKRGTIFDKNGEVLAEEIPSYTIIAILDEKYKNRVEDPEHTAVELSKVLEMDAATIEEYIVTGMENERVQVEFGPRAKYLSYETMKEIEALKLPGIVFREDPRRFYPKQSFASHILGYTEKDMSNARMGLESSLNEYLQEEDGSISYQKDGKNRRLVGAEDIIDPAKNGDNVYLTLDTRIQMVLEQTMNQVEEEFQPERIMAIVANAKTGEILGMSNRPTFNPNQYESISNYTNFTISSRFEPGSTMKIFTLAAAIEEGVFNGNDDYQSGEYIVDEWPIRDHFRGGWGRITFEEGLQRSSNVAFTILALEKLGEERFYNYLHAFGFGEPSGIDLPNEANSSIVRGSKSELATTAFGQGTAVTPIQQVQAATAIANGGKMMKPYIVDRIVSADTGETIIENNPEVAGEPISEETAEEVLELLETVVTSEVGTGRPYAIEGYHVAGKTGTAQIPNPEGGYLEGHGNSIFSFLGMAPAEDPEVIVYVAVDRPQLEEEEAGSTPVSMIFKAVMQQSLQYLNISPSETTGIADKEEKVVGEVVGQKTDDAVEVLKDEGYQVIVLGDGSQIKEQYPQGNTKAINGERILLKTDGEKFHLPDLSSWSLRQVYALKEMLQLDINIQGSGFVQSQSPEPGSVIDEDTKISVTLNTDTAGTDAGKKSAAAENDEDILMD